MNNPHPILAESQIESIVADALAKVPNAKRVLALTTDYSRHDFTDVIFKHINAILKSRQGVIIDVLNTAGTHRAMKPAEWVAKLGAELSTFPLLGGAYDHIYDDPDELITVGELSADFIREKTVGYVDESLPVTVNKRISQGYDLVIGINGTIPHEGTGFSGGTKIVFPGIAGPEVTGTFHWAAVMIGIRDLIGTRVNSARDIVDAAAKLVFDHIHPTPVLSLNMVCTVDENNKVVPNGLFSGFGASGFDAAHQRASELSAKLHIVYLDQPLTAVVQQIPFEKYDEWWTAMKGSYKLQKAGVLAEGAEVILLAPEISEFHSRHDMDADIRKIGYHGRDYVADYVKKHPDFNKNVASHVINARGLGEMKNGAETFPFRLTIASKVPPEVCQAMGLGYRDPATLKREDFIGPGKLWIEHGGQDLYSLK